MQICGHDKFGASHDWFAFMRILPCGREHQHTALLRLDDFLVWKSELCVASIKVVIEIEQEGKKPPRGIQVSHIDMWTEAVGFLIITFDSELFKPEFLRKEPATSGVVVCVDIDQCAYLSDQAVQSVLRSNLVVI